VKIQMLGRFAFLCSTSQSVKFIQATVYGIAVCSHFGGWSLTPHSGYVSYFYNG
jgi:hypothetical protein